MTNKNQIEELYKQGFTYEEIGQQFGVSRQRIHQILRNYHNYGRLNREEKYRNWGICKDCEKEIASVLHHIDLDNSNDEISNLIQLCQKCHNKRHTGVRSKHKNNTAFKRNFIPGNSSEILKIYLNEDDFYSVKEILKTFNINRKQLAAILDQAGYLYPALHRNTKKS